MVYKLYFNRNHRHLSVYNNLYTSRADNLNQEYENHKGTIIEAAVSAAALSPFVTRIISMAN